ncbi:unnamed protein product [Cyclocybe aegerita]|uniref:DUF6534 domain-containing protein n=1 Tax=Cyclocybe aegerita TaxID=1973307 RepID=A0A8S0WGZ4_CYCAE|nr:unnamed protein product [Cyclocybe aegerita]
MSNLGPTLGVLVLGVFLNTYLYGVVSYQYMAYANTKFNDPLWMKCALILLNWSDIDVCFLRVTVLALFLLDTVHTASLIHMAWYYTISHFADVTALSNNIWGLPFTVLVTALIASLTQLFLGYRHGFVSSWSALLCQGVVLEKRPRLSEINSYLTAWLSVEVAVDAIVSSVLIYSLIRSRTGFETSDTIINRLMRATIQTGVFCGICSILALVMFLKKPDTQLYGLFGFPISRLYTNSSNTETGTNYADTHGHPVMPPIFARSARPASRGSTNNG